MTEVSLYGKVYILDKQKNGKTFFDKTSFKNFSTLLKDDYIHASAISDDTLSSQKTLFYVYLTKCKIYLCLCVTSKRHLVLNFLTMC